MVILNGQGKKFRKCKSLLGRVTWGKMPPLSSIGHNFLYNWSIAYLSRGLDTIQHSLSSTGPMICSTTNKYVEY